jgi:hypothetical protein
MWRIVHNIGVKLPFMELLKYTACRICTVEYKQEVIRTCL